MFPRSGLNSSARLSSALILALLTGGNFGCVSIISPAASTSSTAAASSPSPAAASGPSPALPVLAILAPAGGFTATTAFQAFTGTCIPGATLSVTPGTGVTLMGSSCDASGNLAIQVLFTGAPGTRTISAAQPGAVSSASLSGTLPVPVLVVGAGQTYTSVKTAVAAAVTPGTIVAILPGTYAETGQIAPAISLGLEGQSATTTIINPTADMVDAADSTGAWVLGASGQTLSLTNLTFNGNGFNMNRGVEIDGTGQISGCVLAQIAWVSAGNYNGTGLDVMGTATVQNTQFTSIGARSIIANGNVTVTGSVFTGKGAITTGFDYGVAVNTGGSANVSYSTFQGFTGSGGGYVSNVFILFDGTGSFTHNLMYPPTEGGVALYVGGATAGTNIIFTNNAMVGGWDPNGEYGVYSFVSNITIDAENCWWGDPTGPQTDANPSALGVYAGPGTIPDVSNWLTSGTIANPSLPGF